VDVVQRRTGGRPHRACGRTNNAAVRFTALNDRSEGERQEVVSLVVNVENGQRLGPELAGGRVQRQRVVRRDEKDADVESIRVGLPGDGVEGRIQPLPAGGAVNQDGSTECEPLLRDPPTVACRRRPAVVSRR
jgi:hypothetical protein